MASPTVAANAYASLARILDSGGAGKGTESGGPSFGAVLKDAIGSVLDAGKKSDAQTVAMASGKANVMDVVTAVAETDVAGSTLVSVRDRGIQSYEEIMKMPICSVLILRAGAAGVSKDGEGLGASWLRRAPRALLTMRGEQGNQMTGAETLDVARDAIWTIVVVSSPLMVVGLVVGVVVSLFQALTQIQEQTLVFVPKILAIFVALLLALPFMADSLHGHMMRLSSRIIGG